MFSTYFEKSKNKAVVPLDGLKKKYRHLSDKNNLTSKTVIKYNSSNSNSPSPNKPEKSTRKTSPGVSSKCSSTGQSTRGVGSKLKKIIKVEAPQNEKKKSSNSPKPLKPAVKEFLSSRALTGLMKPLSIIKPTVKEKSFRAQSNSNKNTSLTQIASSNRPKFMSPKGVLTQKVSRETSNKSKGTLEIQKVFKPKVLQDFSKAIDRDKKNITNTLFLQSAKNNEAEKCLQLLSATDSSNRNANINCQDKDGWSALHHACWNENLKLVNILLYNDADVKIRNSKNHTPLCLAAIKGNLPIMKV